MYSPNSAYEAGRRLGRRHADVWISEDELVALVSREILPQVHPRSAQLTRAADQFFSYAVLFTVLTAISTALLVAINVFGEETWMPEILLQLPDRPVRWAPVVLGPLMLILWIGYWTANTRATGERRRLRGRLARAAYNGAVETLSARRDREIDRTTTAKKSNATKRTAPGPSVRLPPPSPGAPPHMQIYRTITPRDAEELAAGWMRSMGASGVKVTRFRGDGGIDVTSTQYIAQVKHFATNVGVAPIRELSGVVRADGRRGLFFATNGYSPGAIEFADRSGIALFRMYPDKQELRALNTTAQAFLKHGLKA